MDDELKTPIDQLPQTAPIRQEAKRAYTPPKLTEHGSAKEVTLQTFFGSFSPTPPPP